MGVLLEEVIEAGGYDLRTEEGARWLLSKSREWDGLLDKAADFINRLEEEEDRRLEEEYNERMN